MENGAALKKRSIQKKMLVFHSAYTFDYLTRYGLEIFVFARDAAKFFDKILTVSPIASLQYDKSQGNIYSRPEYFVLDDRNTILEGRFSRFKSLELLPRLNFALAQISLFKSLISPSNLRGIKVVRAEDPRLNGLYAYIFSCFLRKPFVVGLWGNPKRIRELNKLPIMPKLFSSCQKEERFEKFILRRADLVLAQNQENLTYALEAGVAVEKTSLTPLGVGIDKVHFFQSENRLNVEEDFRSWSTEGKCVLLCISRLESLKNVDHAIMGASVLAKAGLPFKLILIGAGREQKNLRELARRLNIENHVVVAGNRSQAWVAGAINRATMNIAPLCGRSLLEASLGGLPTVAYDVDWHHEIVVDGVTGFLVPNMDHLALGMRIIEMWKDSELRDLMGASVKIKAFELASPDVIARKQRLLYEALCL